MRETAARGELSVRRESEAVYHTLKHYDELPAGERRPRRDQPGSGGNLSAFREAAFKTIREGSASGPTLTVAGTKKLVFQREIQVIKNGRRESQFLGVIVEVDHNGHASIVTMHARKKAWF